MGIQKPARPGGLPRATADVIADLHQSAPEGDIMVTSASGGTPPDPLLPAIRHLAYHQALQTNLLDQPYAQMWP